MRVVYEVCCGVDVHKSFLVATIITTVQGKLLPKYQKKRFSTFNNQILEFKKWLLQNNCHDVCMESTGKYWIPVSNLLEDTINVTIANPKWVQAVKGNKDDVKDSKWIGELFRLGLVPGSFIPPKNIRVLREFTRYRYKLVNMRSSEKNRFRNALTVCNIALDSVVSDIYGKSSQAIIEYLVKSADNTIDRDEVTSLLQKSLKKKADDVITSIDGYLMTDHQKERMKIIRSHIDNLTENILQIDSEINTQVEQFEDIISLLCTIPGVDRNIAITIISEIGTDMSVFSSSKRLCSWAGLTPGNNKSAGKKKSVRVSHAGVYLKPTLVQAAHAAVKDKISPYYANKFNQIMKRRGKKRAIIAIARMILTAAYHMIQTGEVWNPVDLYKIDMPDDLKEQQHDKQIKKAINLLRKEGLISDSQNLVLQS